MTASWEIANNRLEINRGFFWEGETAPCELQLLGEKREFLESCEGGDACPEAGGLWIWG